jgi:hypothetical protein
LSVTEGQDESGREYLDIQYFNSKYISANAISIGFQDNLPARPDLTLLPDPDASTRLGRISDFKMKLERLFEKRPIWTRAALANELQCDVANHFLFHALPYIAYVFQQGPWRQCWVKYEVDPRADIQYRIYQIIDLRTSRVTKQSSHIYDGNNYTSTKTFQLCDIVDINFKQIIHSIVYCQTICTYRDGWYIEGHLDSIREKIKQGLKKLKQDQPDNETEEESEGEEVNEKLVGKQIQDLLDSNDDDYFELLEEL